MSVRILVDTGSDMLPDEAEALGITLLPLLVRFGDEEFSDGFQLSRDEFYTRLGKTGSRTFPKTSQISPAGFEDAFRTALASADEVLCLTMSSDVSGCYQSALIAAEEFDGRVQVVDSRQFCGTEYVLAIRAAQLRDQGLSACEMADTLTAERLIPRVISLFDTLEYLHRGGRLSAAAAVAGELLHIKPVVTICDGVPSVFGRARGTKNGFRALMDFVHGSGGINFERPVVLSWSGFSDEMLKKFLAAAGEIFPGRDPFSFLRSRVGPTVGTYSGPDAFALSYYPQGAE